MSIYNFYDNDRFGKPVPIIFNKPSCSCSGGGNSDKDSEQDKLISELKKMIEENSEKINTNEEKIAENAQDIADNFAADEEREINIYYEDSDSNTTNNN